MTILKAHTHAASIPALALVKLHLFLFSLFVVEESFWRFVLDDGVSSSIELKYFLKRLIRDRVIPWRTPPPPPPLPLETIPWSALY